MYNYKYNTTFVSTFVKADKKISNMFDIMWKHICFPKKWINPWWETNRQFFMEFSDVLSWVWKLVPNGKFVSNLGYFIILVKDFIGELYQIC